MHTRVSQHNAFNGNAYSCEVHFDAINVNMLGLTCVWLNRSCHPANSIQHKGRYNYASFLRSIRIKIKTGHGVCPNDVMAMLASLYNETTGSIVPRTPWQLS